MNGLSGRATAVLGRFPCHFEALDSGKTLAETVGGLADELDVLSTQIGHVRRAHRLAEVPTTLDLLRLAALHDVSEPTIEPAALRFAALAATEPVDTARLELLTGLARAELDALGPVILAEVHNESSRFTSRLARQANVVADVIDAQRMGNGTSSSILAAACGLIGFDLVEITHSADRWWHLASCTDGIGLVHDDLSPASEIVALEENPFNEGDVAPVARRHGDRFRIIRGGLEDVTVSAQVIGVGDRTVAPMVVNLDAGTGVVYEGLVPDQQELVFESFGRVILGGTDVTGSAFGFEGGVFASANEVHPNDFVFADADDPGVEDASVDPTRIATFVTTSPPMDAFGQNPAIPHGGGVVPSLPMAIGESRWAFFVRTAHFGSSEDTLATPRFGAGIFDEAVFIDATGPLQPSAEVGFRWEEREPFAVCLYLPARLAEVDDEDGTILRQPLRELLKKHRAAGVRLQVKYADPRWELGSGIVRDDESGDALGIAVSGTTLWPDGTPQTTTGS